MRLDCLYSKEVHIVDCLEYIVFFFIPPYFQMALDVFKQLCNSLILIGQLAGLNFWAQKNQLKSPDGGCAISAGLAGHKVTLHFCSRK